MRHNPRKLLVKFLLGTFIGSLFSWWLYRMIPQNECFDSSVQISAYAIGLGLLFYILGTVLKVFRWRRLLFTCMPLSFLQVNAALLSAYAMNNILPFRLGELFRADLCKRWYAIPRSTALATIFIERVGDGMILVCALIIGSIYAGAIHNAIIYKLIIVSASIFLSLFIGFFCFRKLFIIKFLNYPPLKERLSIFQQYLQGQSPGALCHFLFITIVIWIFEGLSIWATVKATGTCLTILQATLLMSVVSLSTLLPSAPGFLGTMQFAFSLVMMAIGYSTKIGILAGTIQVALIGSFTAIGLLVFGTYSLRKKMEVTDGSKPNSVVRPSIRRI